MENQEYNQQSELKESQNKKIKKGWKRELLEWIITIVAAVVIAFTIRTFVFEPVKVEGRSMYPTLENGEIMIVTKYDYILGEPKRFDIITCHYPQRKENFVKRIVGLPGDTVSINEGILKVNGVVYQEEYLQNRPNYEVAEFKVPEDKYYVLGDNRSNSNDSHLIGPITRKEIIGHARLIVFPFSQFRNLKLK